MTALSRPARPVTPRHAASLVIYEQRADDLYVLMGKRSKKHRFLPDVYVFPGGRVDPADAGMTPLAPLNPEIAAQLSQPAGMAHAIANAAVRETHEETGLVIGDLEDDLLRPDHSRLDFIARAITPTNSPIRFNTRFLTIEAAHVTGDLGGSGELIDLRWIPLGAVHEVPLIDVTEFVLGEVDRKIRKPRSVARPLSAAKVPLFTYYRGRPFIRHYDHG
tara:strand:+ start:1445 stop:2101 length:657 start_codon:yes stop_codon:yes gene_type:complete